MLDPRFTPELQKSLCATTFYLYESLADIHSPDVKGTGILAGYPIGNPVTHWVMYLVAPAALAATGVAAVGRMNAAGGGIYPLATGVDTWHAPEPTGLAVCLIGLHWDHVDYRFVPLRPHCADKGSIGRLGIGDAHPVAAIGASPNHRFADRNKPQTTHAALIRSAGTVALSSDIDLLPGAAIYAFTDDAIFDRELMGMESPYWGPWLLGLTTPADPHSIISIVQLHDLLESPYIKEQRDKHSAELNGVEEPRVTAVAAMPSPNTNPMLKKRRRTSSKNLHAFALYQMITDDFETVWNAMAQWDSGGSGRGNFMLCRQVMSLLEWIANVCKHDETGTARGGVSAALAYIDRRYFTLVPPGAGISAAEALSVPLPTAGHPQDELLAVIFDLARNGLSHQYQQVVATLRDGTDFSIQLTGVELGRSLDAIRTERPERIVPGRIPTNTTHLTYIKQAGAILLTVSPAILYLDLKRAIEISGLLSRVGDFPYVTRRGRYQFTGADLEQALRANAHPEFQRPR